MKANFFLIIIWTLLLASCTSSKVRAQKYAMEQAPNNLCCAARSPQGKCVEELVPGCANGSSPLFKQQFFMPDDCCAYWGVDGMCYEELVKGCSR